MTDTPDINKFEYDYPNNYHQFEPELLVQKKDTLAEIQTIPAQETPVTTKKTPSRKSEDKKSLDPNYILNPQTGRYVLKTGDIGRRLLYGENPPPKKLICRPPAHRRIYKITKVSRQQERTSDPISYVDPAQLLAKRNGRRTVYKITKIGRHDPIPENQQMSQTGGIQKISSSTDPEPTLKIASEETEKTISCPVKDRTKYCSIGAGGAIDYQKEHTETELVTDDKSSTSQPISSTPLPPLNQLRELLDQYQGNNKDITHHPRPHQSSVIKPSRSTGPLYIYTDGSVTNNRRNSPLASGGIGIYFGPQDSRNVAQKFRYHPTTNQRTELYAIIKALKIIRQTEPIDRPIIIFTDSMYALKTLKKNWKAKENLDLLKKGWQLLADQMTQQIEIRHVKAHTGRTDDPHFLGNAQADKLANLGREK